MTAMATQARTTTSPEATTSPKARDEPNSKATTSPNAMASPKAGNTKLSAKMNSNVPASHTHLRAHETKEKLECSHLLANTNTTVNTRIYQQL